MLDRFVIDEAHCVSQARLAAGCKMLSVISASAALFVSCNMIVVLLDITALH